MEAIFSHMPLALFTTLASVAAGAYIALAVALFSGKFSDEQLKKIDKLTIAPLIVLIVGFIAAFFHLTAPLNAFGVFSGIGASPLSNEILAGVVFTVVAIIYTVLVLVGKLSAGARKGFAAVVAVLGIVFAVFMGTAYMMNTIASWNTPLVPVQMVGYALAGGAIFATWMLASAGALGECGSAKTALFAVAIVGAILGIAGFGAQLAATSGMSTALFSGAALVESVMMLAVIGFALIIVGVALQFVATRAASPAVLALVGLVAVVVGILLARLAFYAIELSVGLGF